MDHQEIINSISDKINKDMQIAPCLFFGKNKDILFSQVQQIAQGLCQKFEIPLSYIFTFSDNGEKIKIAETKSFLQLTPSRPGYRFQVFIIEDISRFTLQAANSCLKIFEEPGIYNIFLLSSESESGVLDTILSRTQTFNLSGTSFSKKDDFFFSLIENYIQKNDPEIISYFIRNKVEKEDNIKFLENLILYAKHHLCFIDLLEEINEDIALISRNNVSSKYIVDKYIIKLK